MIKTVNGSTPFQVIRTSAAIAPTTNGYTLAYSADGINFTPYVEGTPADENLVINGLQPDMWLQLSGNTDDNVVVLL